MTARFIRNNHSTDVAARSVALFLTLALTLPSPALALRQTGLEESSERERLVARLTSADPVSAPDLTVRPGNRGVFLRGSIPAVRPDLALSTAGLEERKSAHRQKPLRNTVLAAAGLAATVIGAMAVSEWLTAPPAPVPPTKPSAATVPKAPAPPRPVPEPAPSETPVRKDDRHFYVVANDLETWMRISEIARKAVPGVRVVAELGYPVPPIERYESMKRLQEAGVIRYVVVLTGAKADSGTAEKGKVFDQVGIPWVAVESTAADTEIEAALKKAAEKFPSRAGMEESVEQFLGQMKRAVASDKWQAKGEKVVGRSVFHTVFSAFAVAASRPDEWSDEDLTRFVGAMAGWFDVERRNLLMMRKVFSGMRKSDRDSIIIPPLPDPEMVRRGIEMTRGTIASSPVPERVLKGARERKIGESFNLMMVGAWMLSEITTIASVRAEGRFFYEALKDSVGRFLLYWRYSHPEEGIWHAELLPDQSTEGSEFKSHFFDLFDETPTFQEKKWGFDLEQGLRRRYDSSDGKVQVTTNGAGIGIRVLGEDGRKIYKIKETYIPDRIITVLQISLGEKVLVERERSRVIPRNLHPLIVGVRYDAEQSLVTLLMNRGEIGQELVELWDQNIQEASGDVKGPKLRLAVGDAPAWTKTPQEPDAGLEEGSPGGVYKHAGVNPYLLLYAKVSEADTSLPAFLAFLREAVEKEPAHPVALAKFHLGDQELMKGFAFPLVQAARTAVENYESDARADYRYLSVNEAQVLIRFLTQAWPYRPRRASFITSSFPVTNGSGAGLEERYADRVQKSVVRWLSEVLEEVEQGLEASPDFAATAFGPQSALVKGAGDDRWYHLHIGSLGLLFRLVLANGEIVGISDLMAEPSMMAEFEEISPNHPPLRGFVPLANTVPQERLDLLQQRVEQAIRANLVPLKQAISQGKYLFVMGKAIGNSETEGLFEMLAKKDLGGASTYTVLNVPGLVFERMDTATGLEETVFELGEADWKNYGVLAERFTSAIGRHPEKIDSLRDMFGKTNPDNFVEILTIPQRGTIELEPVGGMLKAMAFIRIRLWPGNLDESALIPYLNIPGYLPRVLERNFDMLGQSPPEISTHMVATISALPAPSSDVRRQATISFQRIADRLDITIDAPFDPAQLSGSETDDEKRVLARKEAASYMPFALALFARFLKRGTDLSAAGLEEVRFYNGLTEEATGMVAPDPWIRGAGLEEGKALVAPGQRRAVVALPPATGLGVTRVFIHPDLPQKDFAGVEEVQLPEDVAQAPAFLTEFGLMETDLIILPPTVSSGSESAWRPLGSRAPILVISAAGLEEADSRVLAALSRIAKNLRDSVFRIDMEAWADRVLSWAENLMSISY